MQFLAQCLDRLDEVHASRIPAAGPVGFSDHLSDDREEARVIQLPALGQLAVQWIAIGNGHQLAAKRLFQQSTGAFDGVFDCVFQTHQGLNLGRAFVHGKDHGFTKPPFRAVFGRETVPTKNLHTISRMQKSILAQPVFDERGPLPHTAAVARKFCLDSKFFRRRQFRIGPQVFLTKVDHAVGIARGQ